MKTAQIYCTALEMILDMGLSGFDPSVFQHVKAASRTTEHNVGQFIPSAETKKYAGGNEILRVDSLLSATRVTIYGVEITDFMLLPETPLWSNGPFTALKRIGGWATNGNEITGSWGKYSELKALGFTATLALGAGQIVVTNGAKLAVGMVLKVEDEQILVTSGAGSDDSPSPTAAVSTVAVAVEENGQIISVTNGAEFFPGETIQIGIEDLYIRKIAGNDLYVTRGWNHTPQSAILLAAAIKVYRTYGIDRGMNGTVDALHTSAAVSRYVVPEDVNWLCRQIAGLMHLKAESKFAGRIGSSETGEAGYYSEFPPNQIDRVKSHYKVWAL